MLIWCLKQVKGFILKFSTRVKLLLRDTKLLNLLYIILFFTLGGSIDEAMVRFQLIKEIIRYANSICISFSVKDPQRLRES